MTSSRATGINNSREISGFSWNPSIQEMGRGFYYYNGLRTDFTVSYGNRIYTSGINASGQIAVNLFDLRIDSYGQRAAIYSNGVVSTLDRLNGGESSALAINDAGVVAGTSWRATSTGGGPAAAIWHDNTPIEVFPSHPYASAVNSIANNGNFVGTIGIDVAGHETAFSTIGGVFEQIALPNQYGSTAVGINESNQVLISAWYDGNFSLVQSGIYENGVFTAIAGLGGSQTYGLAINENGDVVGRALTDQNETHAFLYRNGTMYDLNSLIDPSSGWVLNAATGINDHGDIVGYGFYNGEERGFLISPQSIPEPTTMIAFAGLLMAGAGGRVLRRRFGWRKREAAPVS